MEASSVRGIDRHDEGRRQHEGEPHQLEGIFVEGRRRRDRGIDAGVELEGELGDAAVVDDRAADDAGLRALDAEPAQARGREHEPRPAAGDGREPLAELRLEALGARDEHRLALPLDEDRPAGADFGKASFHRGLAAIGRDLEWVRRHGLEHNLEDFWLDRASPRNERLRGPHRQAHPAAAAPYHHRREWEQSPSIRRRIRFRCTFYEGF